MLCTPDVQSLHRQEDPEEIAAHFCVDVPPGFNTPEAEVYPGAPGMVVRQTARRTLGETQSWRCKYRLDAPVTLFELVEASHSPAAAARLSAYTFNDRARDSLARAGRAILTDYLPTPGACALMSALYAEAVMDLIDDPIHVVAGTLDADGVRVFGRMPLATGPMPFLRSDLDWDGHMWVMVGDRVADISLLRTAKNPKSPPALKRLAVREFGPSAGLVVWPIAEALDAGLRYGPRYVLTPAEIKGLANGGRATLPRA